MSGAVNGAVTGGAAAAPARRVRAWLQRQRHVFDARHARERWLLAAALAAAVFMVADQLWLSPALAAWQGVQAQRRSAAEQQLRQQQALVQAMQQQLEAQRRLQTELKAVRERVRVAEQSLRTFEDTLVGPDQMLPLLERMLASHGQIRVRAMKSLAPTDLLGAAAPAPGAPAATPVSPQRGLPSLYRHGVELTLEGTYAELLAYVEALEGQRKRLLWGALKYEVEQHPRALLTLRLYTLSTARHWIEI